MEGYVNLKEKLANDQIRYHHFLQIEGGHEMKREYFKEKDSMNFQEIAKYNL